jgi:hypothetical protein
MSLRKLTDRNGFTIDEFLLEAQMGSIPGISVDWNVGYLITPNTLANDMWELGGTYNYPTEPVKAYLHSDSDLDTGAVLVEGLDNLWHKQTAVVTLMGTTPVDSGLDWIRVDKLTNVGSANLVGNVFATRLAGSEVVTDILAYMSVGNNDSLQCLRTIPDHSVGYLFQGSISLGKGKEGEFAFKMRPEGKVFFTVEKRGIYENAIDIYRPFLPLPPRTDVKVVVQTDSISTKAHASYGLLIVDNTLYPSKFPNVPD